MNIIVNKADVADLSPAIESVHIRLRLTSRMADELLRRCQGLKEIKFTPFAVSQTDPKVLERLAMAGVRTTTMKGGSGRPVELSKAQVEAIKIMRANRLSYRKIAENVGVSHTAIAKHCSALVKYKRWREDY